MRKFSLLILASAFASISFAQNEQGVEVVEVETTVRTGLGPVQSTRDLSTTSKNGHQILPQAGDWGLGIGATDMISYFGNLLNGNTGNGSAPFEFSNNTLPATVIYGKYFIASDVALRGYLQLNYSREVRRFQVSQDLNTDPDVYVTDKQTTRNSGATVGLGIEKRRGAGRIVGVYGAQAYVNFAQGTTRAIDYGNEYSLSNQNPTKSGVSQNAPGVNTPAFANRLTKYSAGSAFGVGAQAFIGVEYFFAPKMSIGGEFYWGITYTNDTKSTAKYEAFEPSTSEVTEYVSKSVGGNNINAGLSNASGAVNLFLYF